MPAPTLHTPRLTLRAHVLSDMEPFWQFYQSERARFAGAPATRRAFWYEFAGEAGSWDLCGHGGWGVETTDGTLVGQVAIMQPPHFPELEIGWMLLGGQEGRGYATEAALAALGWAWSNLTITTLVSYIHPSNRRSIAVAERLGAVHDPGAALPEGETSEATIVYRHRPDADGSPEAYA